MFTIKQFFQLQKRLAKWRESFVKIGFKKIGFLSKKPQNLVHFGPYDLVQISQSGGPKIYQIMCGETLDLQCQRFATVALKIFYGKFAVKIDFPIGHFMLQLLTLTWNSKVFSQIF